MRRMRLRRSIRIPRIILAPLLILALGCGEQEGPRTATLELSPGVLLFTLPRDTSALIFQRASDLAATSQSIYVGDRLARRVHAFSWEGEYLRSYGSSGSGPGEIGRISSFEVGRGDTVRILDSADGLTEVYAPEGKWVRAERVFSGSHEIRLGADTVITLAQPGQGGLALRLGMQVEPVPVQGGGLAEAIEEERSALRRAVRFQLIRGKERRGYVVDQQSGAVWGLRLDEQPWQAVRLYVPEPLLRAAEKQRDRVRHSLGASGFALLYRGTSVTPDGGLWIEISSLSVIGALLRPATAADPTTVITPTERQEYRNAVSSLLFGDRLLMAYETEVRVYSVAGSDGLAATGR